MKKKEKRMILILLVILVIAIVIFAVTKNKKGNNNNENTEVENEPVEEFVQVLEDGTKLNTSTKFNESREVNGFRFESIQFTEQNGQSVLLADVINNTEKAITDYTLVDVILYDKNGQEIITLGGIISPLQPGEKTQFNMSSTLDYANAYDFKIVIK